MAKRFSRKERGFIKDVVNGETGVQAALNNYDTTDYHTAAQIAHENLKKPEIIEAVDSALPDIKVFAVHKRGLDATKTIFTPEGEEKEIWDFHAQAKFVDMAYKRKGSYEKAKQETPVVAVQINNTLHIEELAKRVGDEIEKELKYGSSGTAGN